MRWPLSSNATSLHTVPDMYDFPAAQIPLLDTPQGSVWESNAIARYLARQADKGLFGKTRIDEVSPAHASAASLPKSCGGRTSVMSGQRLCC